MSKNTIFNSTSTKLVTNADIEQDIFAGFKNDRERLKYMKKSSYGKMDLINSFAAFYGYAVPENSNSSVKYANKVVHIEVGKIYTGTVKEFTKRYISFDIPAIPGQKNEIISKENFTDCRHAVENYLLTHNNQMMFEVIDFVDGKYIVSILNAYYKKWMEHINRSSNGTESIDVHIDSMIRGVNGGGYLCHTVIEPLKQITGKTYTSAVFIPGSHIVLNIERNFERWIGKDVSIIPQKFVDFVDVNNNQYNKVVEKSLVGSRKKVLQLMGNQHLYDIFNLHKLGESNNATFIKPTYVGTVTGPINSTKKCGIFVELDDNYITGMLPVDAADLLNYRPGDKVEVSIKEFEMHPYKEPFVIKNNKIVECNVRLVFESANN